MTNPRDDLMALATALKNANWPNVSIGNKALLRKAIECLTEVAQRPATQVVDREAVARAICQTGKFETGEGTCALLCMDQLGSRRKKGCCHSARVHGKLADSILSLLRPAEPAEAKWRPIETAPKEDPERPGSHQECLAQVNALFRERATHPPASPDTSAAILAERERCAAIADEWANKMALNYGRETANTIAAAIRQLPTTERGE